MKWVISMYDATPVSGLPVMLGPSEPQGVVLASSSYSIESVALVTRMSGSVELACTESAMAKTRLLAAGAPNAKKSTSRGAVPVEMVPSTGQEAANP